MYDWIIVGGGSAGCVLAARLSEDPSRNVLLIEAGPAEPPAAVGVPAAWPSLIGGDADWGTVSTVGRFTRVSHAFGRGRGLGGSSLINAMGHLRGHRTAYDDWSRDGLPGWDYASLLPFFEASETSLGRDAPARGHHGPMTVRPAEPAPELALGVVVAAEQVGLPVPSDVSGGDSLGIGLVDLNVVDGRRQSAVVYLQEARGRDNLTVWTDVHARRLLVEEDRCVGVEVRRDGRISTVLLRASGGETTGELLLSAGCIGSPQLLMLSGIGPVAHLRDLGIELVQDAPRVGQNFHDHPMTGISWVARRPIPPTVFQHCEALGLVRSGVSGGLRPDVQLISVDVPWLPPTMTPPAAGYSINVALMAPQSRGSVRLASADPDDHPVVDPNYLDEQIDQVTMVAGLRLARRVGEAPALDGWRGDEFLPGKGVDDDAGLLEHIRTTVGPYYHGVGTCAMGAGPGSVVDGQLRVRGVRGLRVVDASVIPTIVSANTNATVLAVAEKVAALLSGRS